MSFLIFCQYVSPCVHVLNTSSLILNAFRTSGPILSAPADSAISNHEEPRV